MSAIKMPRRFRNRLSARLFGWPALTCSRSSNLAMREENYSNGSLRLSTGIRGPQERASYDGPKEWYDEFARLRKAGRFFSTNANLSGVKTPTAESHTLTEPAIALHCPALTSRGDPGASNTSPTRPE